MKKNNSEFIPALRYNWLTSAYDTVVKHTMPEKEFKTALISQANIKQNDHVLDFGCGSLTLSLMAKKMEPSAYVHAVDVDEKVLKLAEEKRKVSEEDISIQVYDGKMLPYRSSTFEKVISSLVFHHLNKDQKKNSLSEIFRILKPGGELHIADWGKAKNKLMRSAFLSIQLLDGFKTTTDNVKGLLPDYIAQAGFEQVSVIQEFQTIFGTLALYKAGKPYIDLGGNK